MHINFQKIKGTEERVKMSKIMRVPPAGNPAVYPAAPRGQLYSLPKNPSQNYSALVDPTGARGGGGGL